MINDNPEQMHPRIARVQMIRTRELLRHLNRMKFLLEQLGGDVKYDESELTAIRGRALSALDRYEQVAHQRIEPRRRLGTHRNWSATANKRNHYYLFIDECGHHSTNIDPNFPIFCVCGIVVHQSSYQELDAAWRSWKQLHLGSENAIVHEPEVRRRSRNFYRPTIAEQEALINSLDEQLHSLNFTAIVAGIDKQRFVNDFPAGKVDQFLPTSHYLMCIDFVMERFAHFLWHVGDHAQGTVIAEARGQVEDVLVQHELTLLHLNGTQFMPARDFRYLIAPAIRFKSKAESDSGLQVADLLARPAAELMLDPQSRPTRSDILIKRLYDGCQGRPESYGFKLLPARDVSIIFTQIKAEGDAEASPPTD